MSRLGLIVGLEDRKHMLENEEEARWCCHAKEESFRMRLNSSRILMNRSFCRADVNVKL